MTVPTATTFRVDTLHPSRLLCQCCGEPVCELPAGSAAPDQVEGLTAQQAACVWREQAGAIRDHAALCLWRRYPQPCGTAYVPMSDS
jgi:hypothetical protein